MKKLLRNTLFFIRNLLDQVFSFCEVAILCYHSISDDAADTTVSAVRFDTHLAALKRKGYAFVSLDDVVAWYGSEMGNITLPSKAVALTFDDGYADFKTVALPILEKYAAPATIFIVGDREGYRAALGTDVSMLSDEDVAELEKHPLVSIGWHTKTHPNLATLSKEKVVQEISPLSPMKFFAFPGGNYSDTAIEAVKRAGFSAAFSIKRDLVTRGKNRWLLPRLVVLSSDTEKDVMQYASMAQHWYAMFRVWLKKYG